MLRLAPKSTATTWWLGASWRPYPAPGVHVVSSQAWVWPQVTARARSMPSRPGQAAASAARARVLMARLGMSGETWVSAALAAPPIADAPRQAPRVDAGNGDDAAIREPRVQGLGGAPIGGLGDGGAQHAPQGRRGGRFHVVWVGADVADVGKGEGDDLSGIGRIGEDLLVAGGRRVETHFADHRAGGAGAPSPKYRAVGQDQGGIGAGRGRRGGGGGGVWQARWILRNGGRGLRLRS